VVSEWFLFILMILGGMTNRFVLGISLVITAVRTDTPVKLTLDSMSAVR
jgi:hypothetical protein